jgi:phosphoribosylformimino-5-aminoimidazole carboxamide ribotide isomerase
MILLPAVDIRDGRAVRLRQGRFDEETVYADNPLEAARSFVYAGARYLHVVDLDGAREGAPVNLHHLERIAGELDAEVQYGGGLRTLGAVRNALAAGASRVVLGTAALTDAHLLGEALREFGERVRVAIDVRGGRVAVAGWTEATGRLPLEVIRDLEARGVTGFVYTDTDRDGMLEGPDVDEVAHIARAAAGELTYSGGIGSLGHLTALRDLELANLRGVICGKALYEASFTVAEALEALA